MCILDNQVTIVTGAAGGIGELQYVNNDFFNFSAFLFLIVGRAAAILFAQNGSNLTIVDKNANGLEETYNLIKQESNVEVSQFFSFFI